MEILVQVLPLTLFAVLHIYVVIKLRKENEALREKVIYERLSRYVIKDEKVENYYNWFLKIPKDVLRKKFNGRVSFGDKVSRDEFLWVQRNIIDNPNMPVGRKKDAEVLAWLFIGEFTQKELTKVNNKYQVIADRSGNPPWRVESSALILELIYEMEQMGFVSTLK